MESVIKDIIAFASKYIGVLEEPKDSNRGKKIDEIQKYFGMIGQQYCVMFVVYCIKKIKPTCIIPKMASSQALFEWAEKSGFTYKDPKLIKPGDIAIWRVFMKYQGHAALITSELKEDNTFATIEGNTMSGEAGNQRDGGGIFARVRKANKVNFDRSSFYLRGFIDVNKILQQS